MIECPPLDLRRRKHRRDVYAKSVTGPKHRAHNCVSRRIVPMMRNYVAKIPTGGMGSASRMYFGRWMCVGESRSRRRSRDDSGREQRQPRPVVLHGLNNIPELLSASCRGSGRRLAPVCLCFGFKGSPTTRFVGEGRESPGSNLRRKWRSDISAERTTPLRLGNPLFGDRSLPKHSCAPSLRKFEFDTVSSNQLSASDSAGGPRLVRGVSALGQCGVARRNICIRNTVFYCHSLSFGRVNSHDSRFSLLVCHLKCVLVRVSRESLAPAYFSYHRPTVPN